MTEPINREDVIGLLQKLGSEQDAEILAAARQLHAQVTAAGLSWEELLVDDQVAEEPAAEEDDEPANEDETVEEDTETPAETAEKNAASLALIDRLLAKKDISDDFREELEDYKKDIAAGEFLEADRRYVRALHDRLKKRS